MAKNKNNKVSVDVSVANSVRKSTFDELAVMDDETLAHLGRSLSDSISRISHKGSSEAFEVELCYVQREQQVRASRKEAHAKYLETAVVKEVE